MMKKIIITAIIAGIIIMPGIIFFSNKSSESPREQDMAYYAQNIHIPVERGAIEEALGEPESTSDEELHYPGLNMLFDHNNNIEKIEVTSGEFDLLGNGVRVGDPVESFRKKYKDRKINGNRVSILPRNYSISNNTGVSIEYEEEGDKITSLTVTKVMLK